MPPKSMKKQKLEDMLIRVIRVAEILAKGDGGPSPILINDVKSIEVRSDSRIVRLQKTQR